MPPHAKSLPLAACNQHMGHSSPLPVTSWRRSSQSNSLARCRGFIGRTILQQLSSTPIYPKDLKIRQYSTISNNTANLSNQLVQTEQDPLPPPRNRQQVWRPNFDCPEVLSPSKMASLVETDGLLLAAPSTGLSDYYLTFDPVKYCRKNLMMHLHNIPGQYDKKKVMLAAEFTKRLERSLILILMVNHKLHRCFKNLTVNNLCICGDGTFKLRDTVEFVEFTLDGVDRDYANAADLFLELLLHSCGHLIFTGCPRTITDYLTS